MTSRVSELCHGPQPTRRAQVRLRFRPRGRQDCKVHGDVLALLTRRSHLELACIKLFRNVLDVDANLLPLYVINLFNCTKRNFAKIGQS